MTILADDLQIGEEKRLRVRVTLTFEAKHAWGQEGELWSFHKRHASSMIGDLGLEPENVNGILPRVQFMGKSFNNGQSRVFEIKESYKVEKGFNYRAADFVGEIGQTRDGPVADNVVYKVGCGQTGHIMTGGIDCRCAEHILTDVFTLHEIDVMSHSSNSYKTKSGVVISFVREDDDKW